MAASEEYDHQQTTEQDGLKAKEAVHKTLDANSETALESSGDVSLSASAPSLPKTKKTINKKKRNRCEYGNCKKKLKKSRTFLACRCGGFFCADHRLQCDHECTYKAPQVANTQSVKFDSLQERM